MCSRAYLVAAVLAGCLSVAQSPALPTASAQDAASGADRRAASALLDSLLSAYRAGRYEQAIRHADSLVERGAYEATAYRLKGRALGKSGKTDRLEAATEALTEAIRRDSLAKDFLYRARLQGRLGRHEAAISGLNAALRASSKSGDGPSGNGPSGKGSDLLRSVKAWHLVQAGRYDEAIRLYGRLMRETDRPEDVLTSRAEAYYRSGQVKKALADLSQATYLAPEDPQPLQVRAEIYLREESLRAATEDIRRATSLQREARRSGREGSALQPPEARAALHVARSYVYLQRGKPEKAIQDIEKALEMGLSDRSVQSPILWRNRALYHLKTGNRKAACRDLRQALEEGFVGGPPGSEPYGPGAEELLERRCEGSAPTGERN